MKPTPMLLVLALLLALPVAAPAVGPEAPACDGLDLALTLSGLRSGEVLSVHTGPDGLTVFDGARDRVIFAAHCDGLATRGPLDVRRPSAGHPATATAVSDRAGRLVYTHAVTARGARLTVIEPGEVNDTGLHVTSFDNDDVHVADGLGQLVYARTTTPDGALIEREGPAYGCGCERVTDATGRVALRPL